MTKNRTLSSNLLLTLTGVILTVALTLGGVIAAYAGWNASAPVIVDGTGDGGEHTSLAVVAGNPAISYYDGYNNALKYVRATAADGSSWGSPLMVNSAGDGGLYTSLVVVAGNPAISYYDSTNGHLKYVRATNADGSSWGSPITVDSTDWVGEYTSLAVVNGNPAISYYDNDNSYLKYVRATNADGSSWCAGSRSDLGGESRPSPVLSHLPRLSAKRWGLYEV